MSKNSLSSKILALEMELNLAEQDFEILGMDLAYLEKMAVDLDYNISFLKKEAKVVSAAEYKRSCIDLSHISTKIKSIKNQLIRLENTIDKKNKDLDYYYKLYYIELDEYKVLEFRRKND